MVRETRVSLDVGPLFATDDASYLRLTEPESARQSGLRHFTCIMQSAHLQYLRFCDFGASVRRPASEFLSMSARPVAVAERFHVPASCVSVSDVIWLRAEFQMIWIAARRIVAPVSDKYARFFERRKLSERQLVCYAVRVNDCSADAEVTVPVFVSTGRPLPAIAVRTLSRRAIDFGPEPLHDSEHSTNDVTRHRLQDRQTGFLFGRFCADIQRLDSFTRQVRAKLGGHCRGATTEVDETVVWYL